MPANDFSQISDEPLSPRHFLFGHTVGIQRKSGRRLKGCDPDHSTLGFAPSAIWVKGQYWKERRRHLPLKLHCPSPRQAVEQIQIHLARNNRFRPVADDVFLAVIEAIGNAIEHTGAQYTLSVSANKKRVTIDLTDYGTGFNLDNQMMPSPLAERGRGIPIMRLMVDSVEYKKGKRSNTLRLCKNLS